jgi:sigma-B regulation protein RsbU (phosphoserine phosphatase)
MYYQRLHQTIERITSKKFNTENEMLFSVIDELIAAENIEIIGGRIWQIIPSKKGYGLVYQKGKMQKISSKFIIYFKDYPVLDLFARERTFLSDETNPELRKKGIFKYSATGVGDKVKIDGKSYYEYLLAFNSPNLSIDFKYELSIIATFLTSKIKQWRISASEKNLKADLDKARLLQKSILPEHEYSFHDYDLYGLTVPADIVGGDFFDYLEIGDEGDRIGVALGDAASKGVAASAEAMYISGALRMAMTFQIKITPFMKKLNKLVNKIFKDDKFASLFYAELSTDNNGLCLYANAGHNPPMFIRKDSEIIEYLNPTGMVLGVAPKANYTTENINFNPGDVLLIYSDGLTDSTNKNNEEFGEERIKQLLVKNRHLTPKEIALTIMNAIIHFNANGTYWDDKTIVIIKKTDNKN